MTSTTTTSNRSDADVSTAPPAPPDSVLGGFEVEPAALRRAGAAFHTEADLLIEAASRLETRLGQLGPCWGTDAVGARFGATYQPAADQVVSNLGGLSVGLLRIASALRAVADSYEVVDGATVSGATRDRGDR